MSLPNHVRELRWPELGFQRLQAGSQVFWRFVDRSTGATIGHNYATRAELLADAHRFAVDFGCEKGSQP